MELCFCKKLQNKKAKIQAFALNLTFAVRILDTSLSLSMTARGYATLPLWIATQFFAKTARNDKLCEFFGLNSSKKAEF